MEIPRHARSLAFTEGHGPRLRACFKTTRGAAAGDFGCGQGGEVGTAPQRAVTTEPTPATDKRPATRRVFGEKAGWRRCSSVEDPPGVWVSQALRFSFPKQGGALPRKAVSFVAPCHPAFSPKTATLRNFKTGSKRLPSTGCEIVTQP